MKIKIKDEKIIGRKLLIVEPLRVDETAGSMRGTTKCFVAVDSLELGNAPVDARPYAIANPQFKNYPLFGELRGHDNPELIAALTKVPLPFSVSVPAQAAAIVDDESRPHVAHPGVVARDLDDSHRGRQQAARGGSGRRIGRGQRLRGAGARRGFAPARGAPAPAR